MFNNPSIGLISYTASTLLYLVILVISFISLHKHERGKLFLILISATVIWSFMLTLSQIGRSIPFEFVFIAELLHYFTWFYVIQQVSGHYKNHPFQINVKYLLSPLVIIIIFCIAILSLIFNDFLIAKLQIDNPTIIQMTWMLLLSILGLVLIEHLFRNTPTDYRDKINLLTISAGAIFGYDFFVFADALLLKTIDYEYWSARGIVNILIIPGLIIAAVRNPNLAPSLHISRQFVSHSATLTGAGLYLILMSFTGYIIKQESGEWGGMLQVSFLFAALFLLISLFFSTELKLKLKRYLGRSFRNKYDYRNEWNRFSNTLLTHTPSQSIFINALKAVGQIIDSKGATLWLYENNKYQCYAGWKMEVNNLQPLAENSNFIQYIYQKHSLFTLTEFQQHHKATETEHWFSVSTDSWLILPLWINEHLFGFIHLKESIAKMELDIEDHDLLNTIAHHIALSLSLNESISALQQAERFKQMTQMTTFLVHDLKTLLSQLSLLVENGKVHRDNPAFIDDMLDTLEHVTKKMQRLIQQLKEPDNKTEDSLCNIREVTDSIIKDYKALPICPQLIDHLSNHIYVNGNKNELSSSIKHIIQNAVESVDKQGSVNVELVSPDDNTIAITITDNGKGMTQEFINERLFKPFDSTKGVSGMGIGVYQSREYLRSLAGDIQVSSQQGIGTTFTITLPIISTENE